MSRATWTPDRATPSVFARLSGDYNPVHLDEEHARGAGFPTVIIHGMNVIGAAARAAHAFAPGGTSLGGIDIRFANPVLPDQTVAFAPDLREKGDDVEVRLESSLTSGERIMNPAAFTFGPSGAPRPVPDKVDTAHREDDVVGDVYSFGEQEVRDYDGITRPSQIADDEGVPPMMGLLGMTGALEKAFQGIEPERPGTWVHLRQRGIFHAQLAVGRDYVCRIQSGLTKVRSSKIGSHVTIPFLVEEAEGGTLAITGACVLLYSFDKDTGE